MTMEIVVLQELNVVLVCPHETNPDGNHVAQQVVARITNIILM